MATELKVTHKQGNQLLKYMSAGLAFPEKLGKEEFDHAQRAFANDEIRAARKLLLSYSDLWASKRKILFGNADNWRVKDEAADTWAILDPERPIVIRLETDEQERGIYWILLLMAHPASPMQMGVEILDELVWPLVEALGYRRELQEMTGLSQRKPVRAIRKDSDASWKHSEKKVDAEISKEAAKA